MWRSLFLAIGLTLLLLGLESIFVERAVLSNRFSKAVAPANDPDFELDPAAGPVRQKRDFAPPEWAPWSLISASAVVILYSITLRSNAG